MRPKPTKKTFKKRHIAFWLTYKMNLYFFKLKQPTRKRKTKRTEKEIKVAEKCL